MQSNIKKYFNLIFSIILLIISFLKSWYTDELFDALFILIIIPNFILFILFNVCFIKTLVDFFQKKEICNLISLVILLLLFLLFIFFPFRKAKVKYELDRYEKGRIEIVNKIISKEIKPDDDLGNIALTHEYKKYSTGGEITVFQNDDEGQIICFWIFRGMQSGSIQLIYSSGGEELIKKNETGHPIVSIDKLKDNWYYVETNY